MVSTFDVFSIDAFSSLMDPNVFKMSWKLSIPEVRSSSLRNPKCLRSVWDFMFLWPPSKCVISTLQNDVSRGSGSRLFYLLSLLSDLVCLLVWLLTSQRDVSIAQLHSVKTRGLAYKRYAAFHGIMIISLIMMLPMNRVTIDLKPRLKWLSLSSGHHSVKTRGLAYKRYASPLLVTGRLHNGWVYSPLASHLSEDVPSLSLHGIM